MTWGGKFGTKHFTLYGEFLDYKTGIAEKARLEVKNFSDFSGGKNAGYYMWHKIQGNIVDNLGNQFYIGDTSKQVNLKCDREGKVWGFGNSTRLEMGTGAFTILPELNTNNAPQEVIYQIDHALNNVYYLDRIEKCKASQTFVIDVDTNTKHGNYRYLEKYSWC